MNRKSECVCNRNKHKRVICLLLSAALLIAIACSANAEWPYEQILPFEIHLDYWWSDLMNHPEDNCRTLAEAFDSYWEHDTQISHEKLFSLTQQANDIIISTDLLSITLKETFCNSGVLLMLFEIRLLSDGIPFATADLRNELMDLADFSDGTLAVDLDLTMNGQTFWYDSIGVSEDKKSIFLGFIVDYAESDLLDGNQIRLDCELTTYQVKDKHWDSSSHHTILSVLASDDE